MYVQVACINIIHSFYVFDVERTEEKTLNHKKKVLLSLGFRIAYISIQFSMLFCAHSFVSKSIDEYCNETFGLKTFIYDIANAINCCIEMKPVFLTEIHE